MPYGEFIKGAAGRRPDAEPQRDKDIAGTGILGDGPWWWDQAEPVQGRADERNERIDMVTRGMLGLTVACARCHDHKYDPITQKDYYSLAAIFLNTTYHEYPASSPAEMALWEKQQKDIDDKEEVLDDFMTQQSDLYSRDAGAKDLEVSGGRVAGYGRAEEERWPKPRRIKKSIPRCSSAGSNSWPSRPSIIPT